MTVEEIFSRLSAHMVKGLMIHDHFATMFNFLNLCGYRKCHEYHYFEESLNYRCLQNFYLDHFNKLIVEEKVEVPDLIPANWFKHERMDVDASTKRTAIREIYKQWVDWETETKQLYESSYKELYELGEIAAAIKISYFIEDVSAELTRAREKQLNLESHGYDMVAIIDEQKSLYNSYVKKIKETFEDDDNDD